MDYNKLGVKPRLPASLARLQEQTQTTTSAPSASQEVAQTAPAQTAPASSASMSSAPQPANTVPGSSTSASRALVVRDPNQPIRRRRNEFQLLLVDWEKMSL